MNIKIESGIPIPETGNRIKYPFEAMKVGDSFVIPRAYAGAYSIAKNQTRKLKIEFVVRQLPSGKESRVWRTR